MYVPEGVYTEYEGEHIYVPPQTFQQVPSSENDKGPIKMYGTDYKIQQLQSPNQTNYHVPASGSTPNQRSHHLADVVPYAQQRQRDRNSVLV